MAQRRPVIIEDELLDLARARVEIPPGEVSFDYQPDVDMLVVRLTGQPRPTRHEYDDDRHALFNYAGKKLVSIEIFDLYGVFAA